MTPDEIRVFRARLGLTQARLAELLPTPRRTVEDWESPRGKGRPPAYLARALRDLERELAASSAN